MLAKYDDDDDDFDLDDEWKELGNCHSDIDTEDEMIEDEIDDETDDKIEDMIEEEQKDMIEDNNERTRHLDKINKQIDHVNLPARIRNDFSKNVEEICGLMNELHGEIYSDDSWLRLVELNKINVLLHEVLDYVWKTFYVKNREKHERINIDKYKDIDGYVSKYTNIVNDKLELVNRIGEILDCAMIEVQIEVDMINEMKQKENEIDIEALKLMHEALAKILEKWRDVILEMINRGSACSKRDAKKKDDKPDTKKKGDKPDTKKKDNKPDTKKKDSKPDTKKKDNKPDTEKEDNKPDTEKKDNKPDTEKKDSKPDTSKSNIENRVSNRIKYEIQDIAKYRKVLIKMIDERMNMLDLINLRLAESIADTDIRENECICARLCKANRIKVSLDMFSMEHIYTINVAFKCFRDSVGDGMWPKGISYNLITIINERNMVKYYRIIAHEKKVLIKAAHKEIEMIRRLIEVSILRYENIIKDAGEMDIYTLDQACADIDKTIGCIRKIIIMIPSITEKKMKIDMIKENEKRKKYQEVRESLEKMQGLDGRRTRMNVKTMHTKSDNINTTVVSQDFGENTYSKNSRVTTQILQLCHKTLERISTAK